MSTVIPAPYQLPFIVLMILGGLISWAAGYRFFRFVLTLFGFYLGVLIATAALGPSDKLMLVLAGLGGGAVGAVIMFFGYFVGVALVGAGIGALAVHMIWSRLGSDPHPAVVVLAAVAGAAAAMALQRYVTIVATAFAGAWTLVLGGLALTERGRTLASSHEVWIVYPLDPSPSRRSVLLGWLVMGIAGVLIQLRFTSGPPTKRIKKAKT